MGNNLDKNKICDSIRKSKPNELLYLTVNSVEKDSVAKAIKEIEKLLNNGGQVLVIKK
jgi:hypothetical protein